MKKHFLIFLSFLVLANAMAGTLLFYVYFPWSSDIDYEKAQQEVRGDLLDLNIRLASNDYLFSKAIVDRASFDLNRDIKQKRPSELELPKEIKESLAEERYKVYMENDDGPIGILKLNEQNYLVLGPYYASYDAINARDGLAYIVILFIFNSICLWAGLSYFRSKFKAADNAINHVSGSIYLDKKQDILVNVSENTPELANKISQLQKEHRLNLRNQRDLMHAVAHEFRGPMARISFAIDLLTSGSNPKNAVQLKTDIEDSLEELDSLVKEVLDYSRLKDGHQELMVEQFNVQTSLETLIKKITPIYPNKQFEIRNSDTDIECSLDQKLIERCLLNLVRNAAKFSFSKVRIDIAQKDSKLTINVEDDGSGVPPGKRQRIFEPFTRLDHSRSRDSGGAGLGLAIVWSIAKRHQGEIQVLDSEDLGGANFRLELPLEVES